jgi:GNAT superfamily N-acetyltransferase
VPPTIRTATVEDVETFVTMKNDAWRWAYAGILPAEHLAELTVDDQADAWRARFARSDRTDPWVFVAVDGGIVVGVSGAERSRDDDADPATGELGMLYLEPDHVGRGLGRALHDRALAALRDGGFERATAWVLEANTRGRGFYEHMGWATDGVRGDHMVDCANHPMVRYAIAL